MKTTANISKLKPGGYVVIDDTACKVEKVSRSSSGKHGAAKVRVDAVGILDGKRRSTVKPSGENIDVPIVEKKLAQVLALVGENAQLMDMESYEVFELPVPEGLKGKMKAGEEINYFDVMGTRTLKQIK